jgi:hypothetical protein
LLCSDDPAGLLDSLKSVHGNSIDTQRLRWAVPDVPWLLHVKRNLTGG